MRILLFPASYPPVLGGLQTVASQLAVQLAGRGHTVRVVTNRHPRSLPAQEEIDGIPINRFLLLFPTLAHLRNGRFDLFLASLIIFPLTLLRLHWLLRAFRPDVVNIHFPDAQIPFVRWLRRRHRFRLVVSLHGNEIERWRSQSAAGPQEQQPAVSRQHLQRLLQVADAVTACSRYLLTEAAALETAVAVKGRAIHNGLDLTRFTDTTPHSHPRPYLLAYGRLTYKKGFDLLLKAFARIQNDHPDFDLILAGSGEMAADLQKLAVVHGIQDRVHFFGRATPVQVIHLLNGCAFVVIPSRWEPFGLVALEAMAAGKPVLASRVGGLPEFLASAGNNLVAPSKAALAAGLDDFLSRFDNRHTSLPANKTIASSFTWTLMTDRFEDVIKCKGQ